MLHAARGQQAHQDRACDGAETPHDVQDGDEASALGGYSGAGDDVACGKACAEAETHAEQGEVCRAEAGPGHGDASDGSDGGSTDDAGAEIAGGEPGSAELSGEVGGEEGACLGVLNVPAVDECGQKRAEHDGGDAGGDKVKEDGEKGAERLRMNGGGFECV